MSFTLGDILLHFRARATEVDATFEQVERQATRFASQMHDQLTFPIDGNTAPLHAALHHAEGVAQGWAARVRGFLSQALTVTAGTFLTDMIGTGFGMVTGSVIGLNASLESTTIQFATLMKDADAAKAHVLNLFEFAKQTPFETMPIIMASRTLQTFGGAALNTMEHLRSVGDAAAAVSEDIGRVSFWYGRLHSALMGGMAWGEEVIVLQEMGILTADVRNEMERLTAAGASGEEVWAVFANQVGAFDGAMQRMSGTWQGLTSTLADTLSLTGATVFQPVFTFAKQALMMLVALLGTERFNAFVNEAQAVVGRLGSAIMGTVEAILPIVALVWGIFEPLVRVAWQWGTGFIMAFADGISAAVGLVAKAIGGLATLITSLLRPRSPPKVLPDLARWGTQAAEVWMAGWRQADFQQFATIGDDIEGVLHTLVGRGDLAEVDSIPLLQNTSAQLAELLTGFRQTGEVSQEAMDRLRSAAGPAGQAVGDLVEGYLHVERTSRDAARAQEELNDVTERYDAILNPLTAELDGVRRRMQGLRDAERLAKLKQQLATATGPERELIQLEMREVALNRQISAEQTAMKQAQAAAQAKVDAAKQEEQAAQDRLAELQARQKYEAEAVALANRQTALLDQLAQQASETGGVMGDLGGSIAGAVTDVSSVMNDAKDDIALMQEHVGNVMGTMEEMRQRGEEITAPLIGGVGLLTRGLSGLAAFTGLARIPTLLQQAGAALRYLATGDLADTLTHAFAPGSAVISRLIAMRYQVVRFGIEARAAWTTLQGHAQRAGEALRYLATGQMAAALVQAFAPGSTVLRGLVEMRYQVVRFGIELQATGRLMGDSLRFLLTGEVSQGMAAALGPNSPVMQGLVALRTRLVAVSTSAAQGLRLVRASMRFLVTGEVAGGVAGILAAGGGLATLLTTLRQRLVTLGPAAAAVAHHLRDGFTQALANPQSALATLGTRLRAAGSDLLATGQAWAEQILAGMLDRLPDGVRERVTALGPLLLSAFAAVVGGLTLGPLVAGMLLPIGAVVAPLAGLFAPLGVALAAMGGWVRMLVPSAAGLTAAFRTLVQPMALLQPLLNGIGAAALLLGSYLRAPFATLGRLGPFITSSILPAFTRLGPVLLSLRTPLATLFTLGRTLLGFFSPLGILITLVGAFVGAFVSNTNGIRDLTIGAFDPLLQIVTRIGPILWNVLGLFARGDWAGGLNLLHGGLRDLAPILGSAATALQQGIPAIFAAMMQYLGMLGSQLLAWLGAALPPIISALGAWALALLDWIVPMIPPMLAALGVLLGQLLGALGAALPGIIAALAGFVAAFVEWVIVAGPPLLIALGGLLAGMYGWIARQAPGIAGQLGTWILQFIGWIVPTIPRLLLALGGLVASFLGWIVQQAPRVLETLGEWGRQFALWVTTQGIPALVVALSQMFTGLWEELKRLWNAAFADGSIGASLIEGLKVGIQRNWAAFAGWFGAKLRSILPEWAGGSAPDSLPEGAGGAGAGGGAGHRASGGPVRRGHLYVVGEEGPEYFEPGADGMIHPHSVYAAMERPLQSLHGLQDAVAPQRTILPAPSGVPAAAPSPAPAAVPAAPTVAVNLTINHPVLSSEGQQARFTQEILALMRGEVTDAITRILFAQGDA
ncbi:MAG: hypothetical protein EI684_05105 [Candidatus Viridilinea halotolerans]|uniref:Tape measure protein n=1 Tax=Candidatus Viridilinea halotolerans TaxID=2491704 RepID=A0A426U5M2_9CHLR|nr:MAG: hypothetical protein EI684_05105 [Candidatus Viridilinea halotolerans]